MLGKGEELSQRPDDNDVAMTTFLAWVLPFPKPCENDDLHA